MEAVCYAARANLRRLMMRHPNWTRGQLAQATGMSKSWVDKWKKRLLNAPPDDEQVLRGLSRAPHHPPPRLDQEVVDRLLAIRDDPPEGLGRTPDPKAILYYLSRDEALKERGLRKPQSTRTIRENRVTTRKQPGTLKMIWQNVSASEAGHLADHPMPVVSVVPSSR